MNHFSRIAPRLAVLALLAAPGVPLRAQAAAPPVQPAVTTVIVVRHAEKAADDARDPSLSPAGRERALALAGVLQHSPVAAVYATQFRRTAQTGEPVAARAGIAVTQRPLDPATMPTYFADLAREIQSAHVGQTVLVVGHSNTVPALVQALTGQQVEPLTDADYDRLYVVLLPQSGPPRLLQARYGHPGS